MGDGNRQTLGNIGLLIKLLSNSRKSYNNYFLVDKIHANYCGLRKILLIPR